MPYQLYFFANAVCQSTDGLGDFDDEDLSLDDY